VNVSSNRIVSSLATSGLRLGLILATAASFSGCAWFSPDAGMGRGHRAIAERELKGRRDGESATPDEAEAAADRGSKRLRSAGRWTADATVPDRAAQQSRPAGRLQTSSRSADCAGAWGESLPPNPTISLTADRRLRRARGPTAASSPT